MTHFKFTVQYRPGSKNTKVDASSHQFTMESRNANVDPILPPSCFVSALTREKDDLIARSLHCHIPEGAPADQTFVPVQLRTTSLSIGHPGTQNTYQLLRSKFWWLNMMEDIKRFVASCTVCATSNGFTKASMYGNKPIND